LNPFTYQKSKHRRTLSPPAYASYKRYKPYLRDEFRRQCIYCRLPDGVKGPDSFGVDHYRPQKLFPSLETTYSNLFYSCNCCNSRKKNFWPTLAQLRDKKFIPNPCDHVMFEHLQYRRAEVTFKSPAGKQADEILDLNDDDSVKYREFVLDLVDTLEKEARELIALARGIEGQTKQFPEREQELEEEKNSVEADLKKTREHLARLGAI
jgi:hypothetical protein